MPASPEISPETWTALETIGAGIGIVFGSAALGAARFFKVIKRRESPARHVVLEQANLADMKPLHDIAAGVAVLVAEVKNLTMVIGGAIEERATEQEIQRRAEIRAAQMFADMPQRRTRRRPPKPKP